METSGRATRTMNRALSAPEWLEMPGKRFSHTNQRCEVRSERAWVLPAAETRVTIDELTGIDDGRTTGSREGAMRLGEVKDD